MHPRSLILVLVFATGLSACGGGDDNSDPVAANGSLTVNEDGSGSSFSHGQRSGQRSADGEHRHAADERLSQHRLDAARLLLRPARKRKRHGQLRVPGDRSRRCGRHRPRHHHDHGGRRSRRDGRTVVHRG